MIGRAAIAALLLCGCSFEGTFERPTPGLHRMAEQPRADAYEATPAFDDGLVMRHPPAGTVAYGAATAHAPPPLDRALVRDGRARFSTFCAPCHGMDGTGDTVIAEDMALRPPPSLLTGHAVERSDRGIFRIVSRGFGLMPGYADALEPRERWAVVAYVRALQLRARAPVARLPEGVRTELAEATR